MGVCKCWCACGCVHMWGCVHVGVLQGLGVGGCLCGVLVSECVGEWVCGHMGLSVCVAVCRVGKIFPSVETVDENYRLLYCIHFNIYSIKCPHNMHRSDLFLSISILASSEVLH